MADVFGNQGQFTAGDISNFIAANIGNPQAIADAAAQYGISAQDIQSAAGYTPAQQSAYLSSAGVAPTGIAGLPAATPTAPVAPVEPTYGTEKFTAQQIRDYVAANLADPTRIAQAATQFQVKPEDFLQIYTGTETPYSAQQIQDYLKQGTAGFAPRYQDILESSVGTQKLGATDYLSQFESNRAAIERNLGLPPGTLKSDYNVKDFSGKSLENIEQAIQTSGANKYQEALNLSNLAKNIYGFSDEQAKALRSGLLKDGDVDPKAKEFYNQLLKTGLTDDIKDQIMMDAAVRAPQSKFWADNPGLREAYTPIEKLKSKSEGSGQYGIDPVTKIPFGSKKAFDDMFKGGEIVRGANEEFRQQIGQDKLGLDPHSAYAGRVAKGVGIFGVDAGQKDISDFDKIEKEIAKLGGVKTISNGEGGTFQVVYKDVIDPETGNKSRQAVNVESLFYNPKTEQSDYQKYLETQNRLREAANAIGVDANKYTSTKQAYDDLNQKLDGKYLWQGRTDILDPETAKSLGVDPNDHKKHVTMLMDSVGDKVKATKVLRTFDFQDPNTSRGFLGDLATGIGSILSVPPIQLALAFAGGLPALFEGTLGTEAAAGAAGRLATSIGTSLGLEGATADLVGKALLNAGTSGLMTGLATGDLSKAGLSALSGGVGATVAGGLPMLLKDLDISKGALKIGSEIAGGAAARAITGEDPGRYAINRLLTTGISALASMGADKAGIPTKGPGADLFKAMAPIITSKKVNPEDLTKLATAVKAYQQAA